MRAGTIRAALALKKWLSEQRPELANEIFLDVDPKTGLRLGLTGHTDSLFSVAFSRDGRRIVSGSEDTTLRLWPGPAGLPDLLCEKPSPT